ncbi:hypothetical protein AcV7_003263 [Taiwanofungus camphoratus]|nr:hypothetical protein AcV7_003263 [Antrodia cinnamomea]
MTSISFFDTVSFLSCFFCFVPALAAFREFPAPGARSLLPLSGTADSVTMRLKTQPPHMRLQNLRERRSSPFIADVLEDNSNSLLFGPGGQASIVTPQDAGYGAEAAPEGREPVPEDQPPSQSQVQLSTRPSSTPDTQASQSVAFSSLDQTSSVISAPVTGTTATISGQPSDTTTGYPSSLPPSSGLTTSASATSQSSTSAAFPSSSWSSSPSLPLSSSATTSSPPSASSSSYANGASYSISSTHRASVYIGIAFGAIAAVAFVGVLFVWWMRIRRRTRHRALESTTTWPWDRDILGSSGNVEAGIDTSTVHNGLGLWDIHEPMRREPSHGLFGSGFTEGHHISSVDGSSYPLPPAPIHTDARLANPYPTIQIHSANSSVPDLAPDLGRLQVANLMPGDVSSGDEASRAGSSLDMAPMPRTLSSECGTPFEPMAGGRPRFLGLGGSGLAVPWAPLRPRRQPSRMSGLGIEVTSEKDWVPLPYPGDTHAQNGPEVGGWAASLKSNLVNAFNAVVGASGTGGSVSDHLTRPPHRRKRSRKSKRHESVETYKGMLSRGSTMRSTGASVKDWTLEETRDGAGVVHIRLPDVSDDVSNWLSDTIFENDIQKPPTAVLKSHNHELLSAHPTESVTRASSVYSTMSLGSPELPASRIATDPPRLPSIPPMSPTSTPCSTSHTRKSTRYRRHETRKKTHRSRRPTYMTRASSSHSAATSVGSEMSCQSSARSERLTYAEEFAKKMLRERRKRVMEMAIDRRQTRRPLGSAGKARPII